MKKILIIDDDPKILRNVSEILSERNFETVTSDGTDAMELIREGLGYDLILLDLVMPEVDGMDILREVRMKNSEIPVIMMTAFGTIETAVGSMKKGATDYLPKPFRKKELEVTVNRAIEETRFKKKLLEIGKSGLVDQLFSSLNSSIRRKIIISLKESSKSFSEILKDTQVDDPTKLNFHLNKLKQAKIIEQNKEREYILTKLGKKAIEVIMMVSPSKA